MYRRSILYTIYNLARTAKGYQPIQYSLHRVRERGRERARAIYVENEPIISWLCFISVPRRRALALATALSIIFFSSSNSICYLLFRFHSHFIRYDYHIACVFFSRCRRRRQRCCCCCYVAVSSVCLGYNLKLRHQFHSHDRVRFCVCVALLHLLPIAVSKYARITRSLDVMCGIQCIARHV